MNRIFKGFKAIGWNIRNPFLPNRIPGEQVVWEKFVFRKYRSIKGFIEAMAVGLPEIAKKSGGYSKLLTPKQDLLFR